MIESEQLLQNELMRIERAVSARKKALARAAKERSRSQPRRYVVDVSFDNDVSSDGSNTNLYVPKTASVITDKTALAFYCEEIVGSLALIGTIDDDASGIPAKVSIPVIAGGINFFWEVRDTFSDRAWQSAPLPAEMLASGRDSGLRLARPCAVPGGTEIEATITPESLVAQTSAMFSSVDSIAVQICFVGYEVLL